MISNKFLQDVYLLIINDKDVIVPSPPKGSRIYRPWSNSRNYGIKSKYYYSIITIKKEQEERKKLYPYMEEYRSSYIGYFCKRYIVTPDNILKTTFL